MCALTIGQFADSAFSLQRERGNFAGVIPFSGLLAAPFFQAVSGSNTAE